MVLVIGGERLGGSSTSSSGSTTLLTSSRALYAQYPHLKDSALALTSQLPKQVPPTGLLYVSQREFAVIHPQDKNINIVGTDDCTTCVAVVLVKPAFGSVAVGHFEAVCVEDISTMINRLQEMAMMTSGGNGTPSSHHIQMHMVGGFSDTRRFGEEVVVGLLNHLITKEPSEVELVSACVGDLNTIVRGECPWPILYGVGVNVKTGEIFPATFTDKGPDLPLRHSRIYAGGPSNERMLDIYDWGSGLLRIGPLHYPPIRSTENFLQESDEFILQHLTSSPQVEPAHVVDEIKSTLRLISEHPFPEITIFGDNRPRYYKKEQDTGQWTLLTGHFNGGGAANSSTIRYQSI